MEAKLIYYGMHGNIKEDCNPDAIRIYTENGSWVTISLLDNKLTLASLSELSIQKCWDNISEVLVKDLPKEVLDK